MDNIRRISLLLFCACLFLSVTAQEPLIKRFNIRSGNKQPRVNAMLEDKNGLLWLGTDQGVLYFDGITSYFVSGADSLAGKSCRSLFESRNGTIWAGFDDGKIGTITAFRLTPFSPQEGTPKKAITSFAEDDSSRIFFSTKGEGVYCWTGKRLYNIDTDDGLADDYCYHLQTLGDGRIAAGTDGGLCMLSFKGAVKNVKCYSEADGLPDNIIRQTQYDKNQLLLATQDHGILAFDSTSNQFISVLKQEWKYGQVNGMAGPENNWWIATEEHGLLRITKDNGELQELERWPMNEAPVKITAIITDRCRNIWAASGNVIYRISGEKTTILDRADDLNLKAIHSVLLDSKHNLWISPDQQLYKLTALGSGKWKYEKFIITKPENLTDIVSLYEDKYGYFWIGTLGEGLIRFDPATGRRRRFTENPDLDHSSILSVTGNGNEIWTGGFNGITRIEMKGDAGQLVVPVVITPNAAGRELGNLYVYDVCIDKTGAVWFGTDQEGLIVCRSGVSRKYNLEDGLPGNVIHSVACDPSNRIWFTCAEAGVSCYDGIQFRNYDKGDGLSSLSPSSLICLPDGRVLAIHENGLDEWNPSTNKFTSYTSDDGLYGMDPDLESYSVDRSGTVWLGTKTGLLKFQTWNNSPIRQPKIVLTSVAFLDNTPVLPGRQLFEHHENGFRISYMGGWLNDPDRLHYQVRLSGFNELWQSTRDKSVIYSNLPPGTYTFQVRTSLNEEFSSYAETSWSFTIRKPFWNRIWFRAGTGLALAAIAFYILRKREQRANKLALLEREKLRFKFDMLRSQVNPHFLFNSFNTLISTIESDPDKAVEYTEQLSNFFRDIVNYRDKELISLTEEISIIRNYLLIQQKRYGQSLKFSLPEDNAALSAHSIPPMTLQLLAENALKHNAFSKDNPLMIEISLQAGRLSVRNNITPRMNPDSSSGMGLDNIRQRFQYFTAEQVKISNENGIFEVTLPLLKISSS